MKIYIVNHFVGGTPMDGETIGAFDTLEKAKKCLKKTLENFNVEEYIEEQTEIFVYWDADDFWGGLDIQEIELNKYTIHN